jgi:nicotinate phosphoribosyltransferase
LNRKTDYPAAGGFLFTDFYELVMAQLYFKLGYHDKQVQFDHFFRSYPDYGSHQAGYCINAGLEWFVDWMNNTEISDKELNYLKSHHNTENKRIFHDDFLDWLKKNGNFRSLSISAVPEGRVIHPHEPLTVVKGPAAAAQIIETALLNQLNFQILIATKASRIKESAGAGMVMEFGARRAQDRGAIAGVRAALIGGADYSSNTGISYELGYTPKGTHAHSLVQMFLALGMTELDAFEAFADLYPDNCILLVDTVNTLTSGVPNAIKVFERLKKKGHKPGGVRLDSGDLAFLTVETSRMLNDAGFSEVPIVLSNELDEMTIWQITSQIKDEAARKGTDADNVIKRLIYGVGTRLITSSGDPALGGVYKLTSVKDGNEWKPAIKLSENIEKMTNPGEKQVWRIYDNEGTAIADYLALENENPPEQNEIELLHPNNKSKKRILRKEDYKTIEPLLVKVIEEGEFKYEFPSIEEIRKIRIKDQEKLNTGVKRLINPHIYHVSVSRKIWECRENLFHELIKV